MSTFSGIFYILVQHEKAILWESLDPFIKKVAMIVASLLAIAKNLNLKTFDIFEICVNPLVYMPFFF